MRASVLESIKRAPDIEERDLPTLQHDTGGLPGRKFLHTNGFHPGILGVARGFTRTPYSSPVASTGEIMPAGTIVADART